MNSLHLSRCLQVFGEENPTASLLSHAQDQSIPERKSVEAVKVDGWQDVSKLGSSNVELAKQFHFAASHRGFNVKLPRDGDEILLQHLERNNAGPRAPVLSQQVKRPALLGRC